MKIIGFRSGKVWKKILATIGYLMIISVIITVVSGGNNEDNKSVQTLSPVIQEEKVINETQKAEETKNDKTEAEIVKEEIPITNSNTLPKPVENVLPKENDSVDSKPIVVPVVKNEAPITVAPKETTSQTNNDVVVYRGNTGTKYHRSGCRTLKNGQIEMTLSEAKDMGLEACKVCKP